MSLLNDGDGNATETHRAIRFRQRHMEIIEMITTLTATQSGVKEGTVVVNPFGDLDKHVRFFSGQ